jgi:general secretion pathway protein L
MDYLIIQIAENNVTVARFGGTGRSTTLEGSGLFELNGEQDLAAIAARIAAGISGSPRVVLCLPPDLFAQRLVELPLSDLRKVREVLSSQLQGEIALPIEEAVFDALRSSDGKFMALWAKRSDIAAAIDLFRGAGLEPAVVSAAVFAWPALPGIQNDCALFDGSAVAVITDGRLSFLRALCGAERERQLTATLSALEMSAMPLPSRLLVFGEQAADVPEMEGLALTAEVLELPEELGQLFRNDQTFRQLAGLYAVAQACQAGTLPDFRRGDLAWTAGDAALRKKLLLTAALAIVAITLLFVSKGMQYRAVRADSASLDKSISTIYREIFPGRAKAVDEVAEIKGEIRKLAGHEGSSAVLDVLKQLAEAKGAGINGLYEAELEGLTLRVKGDARSAQTVNDFKASLSTLMATIELGEVKSRPDGSVTFSMTAKIKEGK